jgi:hypothetical protein
VPGVHAYGGVLRQGGGGGAAEVHAPGGAPLFWAARLYTQRQPQYTYLIRLSLTQHCTEHGA